MTYSSKRFRKYVGCGHKQWTTHFTSDDGDTEGPPECPQCGGAWEVCDPAESTQRLGNLKLCGRCQARYTDAYVTNAPRIMHDSWCNHCIQAVNRGMPKILQGVSINKEGFVIGTPPPLRPTAKQELVKTTRNLTVVLGGFLTFFGPIGMLSEKGNRTFGLCAVLIGIPFLIGGIVWFYLDYRKEKNVAAASGPDVSNS